MTQPPDESSPYGQPYEHPYGGPAQVPQPIPAYPHPSPTVYALMLRTWTYAPWKPIVGLVLVVLGMVVIAPFALLPVLMIGIAIDHNGPYLDALYAASKLANVTWPVLLWLNLTLAALIPITWAIVRWVHRMRPRWLMSVAPGIRWRFFWACFGVSLVAIAAQLVVAQFLPGGVESVGGSVNKVTGEMLALGLVVLLTTPLQAMGEEYAFRGYAMQAFGSLTRSPWFAILLSATLFAVAHGSQNAPLFLDRFAFGLIAGYLVHRTGGLEAGIALHIWNNLLAFGLSLLLGDINEALNVSEVSWWNIVLTLTQNGVYLVLVLWVAQRMGISNRTSFPAPTEAGAAFEPSRPAV